MPATAFDEHRSLIRWTELPGALPARVFLHGLGSNGLSNLAAVARHPSIAGHRSLVVDLPGHGWSDRPGDFRYGLEDHADAVAAACAAAGVDGIDLIGHSLGADISIVVAHRHPDLVRRLVIFEANLDPLPPSTTARASQAIRAQSEDAFVATGYDHLIADFPDWAITLRAASPIAVHRSATGLNVGTVPTMREMFVAMTIPRTFMHGDRGEPLLDADGLRRSGVRVITIPNAGHMIMFDNPAAFIPALAETLAPIS
jgi:pimeloyl-ACP methyl ester carboxylesterase